VAPPIGGTKLITTPEGCPLALRLTDFLYPCSPLTVIAVVVTPPCWIDPCIGLTEMLKSGGGGFNQELHKGPHVAPIMAASGSGHDNYVGWGVFLGIFKNHKLITPHTVDLLGYENLEFWTKTPIDLKVEIQQDNTEGTKSSPCLISDYGWNSSLPDVWQKVTIPKSAFRNVDLTKIFCPFMITGRGSKITFYVDAVMWIPRKANETK